MTSINAIADAQLALSPRDAQFVAACLSVCASLLNPDATDDAWHNEAMLGELFTRDYSSTEFNDLLTRSRALVPFDSRIAFVDVPEGPTLAPPQHLVS